MALRLMSCRLVGCKVDFISREQKAANAGVRGLQCATQFDCSHARISGGDSVIEIYLRALAKSHVVTTIAISARNPMKRKTDVDLMGERRIICIGESC